MAALRDQLTEMEQEFEARVAEIEAQTGPAQLPLEEICVRPRKADIAVNAGDVGVGAFVLCRFAKSGIGILPVVASLQAGCLSPETATPIARSDNTLAAALQPPFG